MSNGISLEERRRRDSIMRAAEQIKSGETVDEEVTLETINGRPVEPEVEAPSMPPEEAAKEFTDEAIKKDRRAFTSTADILTAARGWCDANGALVPTARSLAPHLKRHGGHPHSNGTHRGWRGIKLR